MFMMISFRRLLLLLLSREFFIFQIADVHLLDSATRWRLLGQKYLLTAEVTRLRLRGLRTQDTHTAIKAVARATEPDRTLVFDAAPIRKPDKAAKLRPALL